MNDGKNEQPEKKKALSTTQIILIVGIVVIVIVLAVGGFLVIQSLNKTKTLQTERPSGVGNVVTAENVEEIKKNIAQESEMFTTLMNAVWDFENGSTASSNAMVGNNKDNLSPFYFEVVLDDTKEVVYTSPTIPVGAKLESLTLDVPLKKGTYNAVCAYNLLDQDNNVKSTVSFSVTLEIAN